MKQLEAVDLALGYSPKLSVVEDLDLEIQPRQITALLGPNGCGKSTLLRGLGRILKPFSGLVSLEGVSLAEMDTLEIARKLSILPQSPIAPEGITVQQLILLGRYPHRRWWQNPTAQDREIVEDALEQTELVLLKDQFVTHLSGGQRQRAWIAMILAQQTSVLLLDEPTTFLDLSHQLDVLQLLQRLNRKNGVTVVMVLHDINHAARFADSIVMMKQGRIVATGAPDEVVTHDLLREVFGVDCHVMKDPGSGRPHCIPLKPL